ncbi:hypothetical protein [Candidatus Symbiopectobacterium sp. 'North America']|uniref:intermembrane phospholipid transport protein YdbH family protein n=1 Tax=Candidatus Symbiopectobacterium sp. 'North America' TaxID=2794574 RepID=UPI001FD2485A|nr:hypothetical protein [Candidatus Symbiopectobacterium sp. 'North America']
MLLVLVIWYTSPQWLASVARSVLPEGASFTLKSRPVWHQGVNTAGVRIAVGDCVLLDVDNIQRAQQRWRVDIDRLTLDTACQRLPQTPSRSYWQSGRRGCSLPTSISARPSGGFAMGQLCREGTASD